MWSLPKAVGQNSATYCGCQEDSSIHCITGEAGPEHAAGQAVSSRNLLGRLALLAVFGSGVLGAAAGRTVAAPASSPQKRPAKASYQVFTAPDSVKPVVEPKFLSREQAENAKVFQPDEPVIGIALGGEARAYSLWQLERRLVVNDRIAGRAIAVTWCPFSHVAAVYSRSVAGRDLTFEAPGTLLNGELVLRDRETGTTWAQADGSAVEGPLAAESARLSLAPALQTKWKVWRAEQPGTLVLDKGGEPITASRYAEYDADPQKMGAGGVELKEPRMGGKALVVGIVSGRDRVAIPLEQVKRDGVVTAFVDQQAMAAIYDPASDTVRVVRSEARGHNVTLRRGAGDLFGRPTPPYLLDEETASRWDLTGRALSGRMEGHRLPLVPYRVQYWYAWQAYFPHSRVE